MRLSTAASEALAVLCYLLPVVVRMSARIGTAILQLEAAVHRANAQLSNLLEMLLL